MNKRYCSLGLMSGTSLDGIDASIIVSDGDKELEIIANYYEKYDDNFKLKLKRLINEINDPKDIKINKYLYKQITNQLTMLHAKVCRKIMKKNKSYKVDFVGFHGQTILHNPKKGISIQMGDPQLLSKVLKKKVFFDFRKKDIMNGGEGAPLAPVYHYLISRKLKIKLPVIFLNLGGIANITYINNKLKIYSTDIGPGNYLIDQWIKQKSKKDYDKNGLLSKSGKIDRFILNKEIKRWNNNFKYKYFTNVSFDTKDFNLFFVEKMNLKDGAATLTEYTSKIISNRIKSIVDKKTDIIVCGGGRKNKTLIKSIKNSIKNNLKIIDDFEVDGDFIESQTFAFLAIRSYLKKYISFPTTTGVKISSSGGVMFRNY